MKVRLVHGMGGVMLAGSLVFGFPGGGFSALAQNTANPLPDAQIESNVLRALATDPQLATQNIQSTTVYGTVTLTGTVQTEGLRVAADNLAARALGVQKVIDQLSVGDTPAGEPSQYGTTPAGPPPGQGQTFQGQMNAQPGQGQPYQQQPAQGQIYQGQPGQGQPYQQQPGQGQPYQQQPGQGQPYQQQPYQGQPYQGQPGQGQPSSGQGYGPAGPPPGGAPTGEQGRQPMYPAYSPEPDEGTMSTGQVAGLVVTVKPGAMLTVRINRGLNSNHVRVGEGFDGTVMSDVVAGGQVAIPRGATVSGVVVGAHKAGLFKGEGALSLQINNVTLGGHVYPITTTVWAHTGADKLPGTITSTAGLGGFGALMGGAFGGGAGAAVGAAVGAGTGLASSAAVPRGALVIPPESVLTFRIAAPAQVTTVSEQEMQRLSYQAGPSQAPGPPPGPPGYYF
ncbi:MAG: BON domain-containing protein [Acidobacteriaceae bacterium]